MRRARSRLAPSTRVCRRQLASWDAVSTWISSHPDVATLSVATAVVTILVRRGWRRDSELQELMVKENRAQADLAAMDKAKNELRESLTTETRRAAGSEAKVQALQEDKNLLQTNLASKAATETQLRESLTTAKTQIKESKRQVEALERDGSLRETKLRAKTDQLQKLSDSVAHRGQLGEDGLQRLLDVAKASGYVTEFWMKPNLGGQIPDAVVEFAGGRRLVVDSKV